MTLCEVLRCQLYFLVSALGSRVDDKLHAPALNLVCLFVFFCNLCMDLITNSTLSLKQPAVALKMISVPKVKCYLGTICK